MVAPLKLKRQKSTPNRGINSKILPENPVAKILVNPPVSHLEDIYDYLVPIELSESVIPGSIVKIEFGKSITEGLVIDRVAYANEKLKYVEDLLGWPGMVDVTVIDHFKRVQKRFGGSLWSLIDSYLPPLPKKIIDIKIENQEADESRYITNLPKFIDQKDFEKLKRQSRLRYSVSQPSGFEPYELLLELIKVRSALGQVLVIASDFREFDFLTNLFKTNISESFQLYDTRCNKSERFKSFQQINLLRPKIILGNRSSSFFPLQDNSSVFVIHDNDKSHYELRTPGWNTRDVTLLRDKNTSLFFFNAAPSFEVQRLIDLNWFNNLEIKSSVKINFTVTEGRDSFIPVIKKALARGNVLVSVANKGYANAFLCNKCRTLASCNCGGKLQIKKANSHPSCYLCGEEFKNWRCLFCGDVRPFVIAKGLDRTAEEIARSIPGSTVRKVFSDQDQFSKSTENQVIVSSRGCEPMINYAGLILLDGEQIYNQPSLRAEEEMKSNWFDLLSRVSDQGFVYISLLNNHPITQQMLIGQSLSTNSLQNRKESRLPPYYRTCQVIGESKALSTFSENLRNQNEYIVTGPLTHKEDRKRLIIRAEIEDAPELVNQMQDIVKMQLLKGKSVFEYRFDQYDI